MDEKPKTVGINDVTLKLSEEIVRDYLFLNGYFNPIIGVKPQRLPEEVYDTKSEVEKIVRDAFPNTDLVTESVTSLHSPSGKWYEGIVYPTEGDTALLEVILYVRVPNCIPPPTTIPEYDQQFIDRERENVERMRAAYGFVATLPFGEHAEQSRQVVAKIWPMIRGFEYLGSKIGEGDWNNTKYHPGVIFLVRDGKLVASGHPAIREEGGLMHLPLKPVDLLSGFYA